MRDNRTSSLAAINKVTAADMNEIKTSVNSVYSNAKRVLHLAITSADFSGSVYTNVSLIGQSYYTQFNIWSYDTGNILKYTTDFTFDIATGAVTMVAGAGNYLIQSVLPLQ